MLLFGDLTLPQAAEITGTSPGALERSLNGSLIRLAELLSSGPVSGSAAPDLRSLQDALHDLASRIFPDPRFLQAVRAELARTDLPGLTATGLPSRPPLFAGRGFRRFAWVPLVITGVIIFAANIWYLPARLPPPQPSSPPSQPPQRLLRSPSR